MRAATINIVAKFTNWQSVRKLVRAAEAAEELAADQPWNDDAKAIVKLIRSGIKGIECEAVKRKAADGTSS